jgi:hypothetical protein
MVKNTDPYNELIIFSLKTELSQYPQDVLQHGICEKLFLKNFNNQKM